MTPSAKKGKTTAPRAKGTVKRPARPTDKQQTKTSNKNIPKNKLPPGVKLQPHIQKAMLMPPKSGTRKAVYELSNNTVQANKKINKKTMPARYGTRAGLQGPKADHMRPITNEAPRMVSDTRQLLIPTKNNLIPDEYGVTNPNAFPMQELAPPSGGKWSGRTGPIR